jgi:hypothetical protein
MNGWANQWMAAHTQEGQHVLVPSVVVGSAAQFRINSDSHPGVAFSASWAWALGLLGMNPICSSSQHSLTMRKQSWLQVADDIGRQWGERAVVSGGERDPFQFRGLQRRRRGHIGTELGSLSGLQWVIDNREQVTRRLRDRNTWHELRNRVPGHLLYLGESSQPWLIIRVTRGLKKIPKLEPHP